MPSGSTITSAPVSEEARGAPAAARSRVGGCLCGAVRYELRAAPTSSALCHCRSCRRASGAPVVGWITVARAALLMTRGTPARFESSPGIFRQFCGRCGSALTYERQADATIDITTASLDDAESFPPTCEVWTSDRLAWQPLQPALAHHERSSLES